MSKAIGIGHLTTVLIYILCGLTHGEEPDELTRIRREAPDWQSFTHRDGQIFQSDAEAPYTGWVNVRHGNEGLALCHFKAGLRHGISTTWYPAGQKRSEHTYRAGNLSGLSTHWFENGEKMQQGNYQDGKLDGLWIFWDREGKEIDRATYKDGKLVGT